MSIRFLLVILFGLIVFIIQQSNVPIDTRKFEGLRLCPYKDSVGKLTVGYGHNVQGGSDANLVRAGINRKELLKKKCITQHQADQLFKYDMEHVRSQVEKLIKSYDDQPLAMRLVLDDMGFNLGIGGLSKFKRFIDAIDSNNYKQAAVELKKTKWYKQVKTRAVIIENTVKELQ